MATKQRNVDVGLTLSLGVMDNKACFEKALAANSLYDLPISYALDHGIFKDNFDHVSITQHLHFLVAGRFLVGRLSLDMVNLHTTVLGEALGWLKLDTNNDFTMVTDEARKKYVRAVIALLTAPTTPPVVRQSVNDFLVTYEAVKENPSELEAKFQTFIEQAKAYEPTQDVPENMTFQVAYDCINEMTRITTPRRLITNTWTVVHGIVAFAKRGNLTNQAVNKIQEALAAELNYQGEVNADVIRAFFNAYGPNLNAETAEKIVNRFTSFVPTHALRLRIILQQAANQGVMSITTIGRAIKLNPLFP